MAKAAGTSLDALAGLAAQQDTELARLLAQLADLSEQDRQAIRRVVQGLVRINQG